MRFGTLLAVVSILPLTLAQFPTPGKGFNCRCLYGESCWPNEQEFDILAAQLSQPLIHPIPPASACYPAGNPSGNCSDVQIHWHDGNWRSDQSGAYQNINFESYTNRNGSISACYLNTAIGLPCEQGSVPPIGVDARTVEDIQAAVLFADEHNLRLVVKNTGHDYLGRSAGRDAFMIWTHNLKNIDYYPNFIPEGGEESEAVPAFTLGAGVQWKEAYAAAQEQQRFILGGISGDMSNGAAGGWIMGGGHSAFSATYGLGVDNVVQFTIVKPDGDHVVANAHSNEDLFWALRGGGAGSWGVVTSATYRTYDLVPLSTFVMNVTFPDPQTAQTVVTEYISLLPTLSDAGWGGYIFISGGSLLGGFIAPNVTLAESNMTINPFFDSVRNVVGDSNVVVFAMDFENFHTWADAAGSTGFGHPEEEGNIIELASRLLSREAAEERPEEVAQIYLSFEGIFMNFVAGGAVASADPESVALNPGWRKAVGHAIASENWYPGASGDIVREARLRVARNVRVLDPTAPDSAAYMNEASLYEPDFKKSFFGTHFDRLRDIKQKYDPKSLFLVAEGVGSEDWDGSLTCPI